MSRESSASPHGSGFITMPAPPPYGVSSTVRRRSWVESRRSWTPRSIRPVCLALPSRDPSSTEKNSGKIVTMSMRTRRVLLGGGVVGLVCRLGDSRLLVIVIILDRLEEPDRRGDGEGACGDVDGGDDRLDEGDQHVAGFRLHVQQILRGQVV